MDQYITNKKVMGQTMTYRLDSPRAAWLTMTSMLLAVLVNGPAGVLSDTPKSCKNETVIILTLDLDEINITSTNYPGEYLSNTFDCWLIKVDESLQDLNQSRVKLEVNDFNIEDDDSRCQQYHESEDDKERHCEECDEERLIVYDGGSEDECKYGLFCGDEMPSPIITKSEMYITFTSDKGTQYTGFHFTVSATDEPVTECGFHLSRTAVILISVFSALILIGCIGGCVAVVYYALSSPRRKPPPPYQGVPPPPPPAPGYPMSGAQPYNTQGYGAQPYNTQGYEASPYEDTGGSFSYGAQANTAYPSAARPSGY